MWGPLSCDLYIYSPPPFLFLSAGLSSMLYETTSNKLGPGFPFFQSQTSYGLREAFSVPPRSARGCSLSLLHFLLEPSRLLGPFMRQTSFPRRILWQTVPSPILESPFPPSFWLPQVVPPSPALSHPEESPSSPIADV